MNRLPRLITLPLLVLFFALTGCEQTQLNVANPLPISRSQYASVFDASINVLRDQGFAIDRKDYRFGIITTRPLISPTVFEPWRGQNTSASLALDSTLNELARKVTIKLLPPTAPSTSPPTTATTSRTQPAGQTGTATYQLQVIVELRQREYPARRLIGSFGASVFNSLAAVPAEWASRGIPAAYWQPIGQDTGMEKELLEQIRRRAHQIDHPKN